MAIEVNDSNKQVVNVVTFYTGLADMSVIAINPTLEEIKALGLFGQKEPEYTTEVKLVDSNNMAKFDAEGNEITYIKTRIDVYLKRDTPKISARLSFWIESRDRMNQNEDKYQWTNQYGAFSWAAIGSSPLDNPSVANWFKADGMRMAKHGEELLVEFLKAWANVENGKRCQLETIEAIAKGDVTELRKYVPILAKSQVRVLLGVKDGQYQVVYDKMFGRTYEKSNVRWIKNLESQYGQFKADYQDDMTLRIYVGKPTGPDLSNTGNSGSGDTMGTGGSQLVF